MGVPLPRAAYTHRSGCHYSPVKRTIHFGLKHAVPSLTQRTIPIKNAQNGLIIRILTIQNLSVILTDHNSQ
jgi:hypothetical protein